MNNRVAFPVTDDDLIMLGIVTFDDILWVANEESTEDIQRIGGMEALDDITYMFPRAIDSKQQWIYYFVYCGVRQPLSIL